MDRRIPLVISEGSPFTRGFYLGRTEAQRIAHTVTAYTAVFQHYTGLSQDKILRHAERFIPAIANYAPELLEEMGGIAEGSGRDIREIVAINARTELMYGVKPWAECTSVGVTAGASADRHAYLAQNWDWISALAGTLILWVVRRENGPDVFTLTEAGIVGKIGINAAGLAMCINLLTSDTDFEGPAVPMHIILRHLLDEARSVEDAVALLASTERCTSCHHLLLDRDGALVGVEATPGGQHVLSARAGVLTHTNHCVDAGLFAQDSGAREDPETLLRGERAQTLAHDHTLSENDLRAILTDHANAPGSICRHIQPDQAIEEQSESIASIIFDLTAGTANIADGPPCQYTYRRFILTDYLRQYTPHRTQ